MYIFLKYMADFSEYFRGFLRQNLQIFSRRQILFELIVRHKLYLARRKFAICSWLNCVVLQDVCCEGFSVRVERGAKYFIQIKNRRKKRLKILVNDISLRNWPFWKHN